VTKPSRKASARLAAPDQDAAAKAALSRTASRGKAAGAIATRRQFQKSEATAIEGHMRSSGQRRQAKRDAR
jgi:hypothetical protein